MGICSSQSKTGPTATNNSPTELTSNTANSSPHQSRAAIVPQTAPTQVQQEVSTPPALDLQAGTMNQQPPQAIPPSGRSEESHVDSPNNHIVHPDIKVHAVITPDLDHDHAQALRIPLGQVTDEQLIAELAERDLDYGCTPSPDYDMKEHHKATKIPLEAVTDDELLAEVERRQLNLHEDIDESLIFESYEMGKILGHGASGKVYLCMHKETTQKFACKVIMKDTKMNDAQSMSTEIEIMKRLRHRHVVSMYELYESPTCLWLILELVDGGDLRSFLAANRQTYSEALAAQHMKQILSGVHYLHSMGVVHRDLKLENILLKRTVDSYEVKIADFGLSALVRIGEDGYHNSKSSRRKLYSGLHEPWGTAEYEAPELLNGAYGPQADIWACGCMLYEMLSGSKAFARREDEKNFDKLYARIRKGEVDFRKSGWWSVTANAKDMIVGMIQVDPQKRLTATEALNHKWIKVYCRDEEN